MINIEERNLKPHPYTIGFQFILDKNDMHCDMSIRQQYYTGQKWQTLFHLTKMQNKW